RESVARFRRCEPYFDFEGERGHALAGLLRAAAQYGEIADGARRERHQITYREAVALLLWRRAEVPKRFGADHVAPRPGAHYPFQTVALAALFDELDQAGLLQLAHVIAHLLSGQLQPPRDAGGGIGFVELLENLQAGGAEEDRGGFGALDHLDGGCHELFVRRQYYNVKKNIFVGLLDMCEKVADTSQVNVARDASGFGDQMERKRRVIVADRLAGGGSRADLHRVETEAGGMARHGSRSMLLTPGGNI